MKIIDNRGKIISKNFSEIKIGETFYTTSPDTIFMKTENFYIEFDDGYYLDREIIANSFCLNNGKRKFFRDKCDVYPVNCECVITNN